MEQSTTILNEAKSISLINENVDIKGERLENQIILQVLGASIPKGQNRIWSPLPERIEPGFQ